MLEVLMSPQWGKEKWKERRGFLFPSVLRVSLSEITTWNVPLVERLCKDLGMTGISEGCFDIEGETKRKGPEEIISKLRFERKHDVIKGIGEALRIEKILNELEEGKNTVEVEDIKITWRRELLSVFWAFYKLGVSRLKGEGKIIPYREEDSFPSLGTGSELDRVVAVVVQTYLIEGEELRVPIKEVINKVTDINKFPGLIRELENQRQILRQMAKFGLAAALVDEGFVILEELRSKKKVPSDKGIDTVGELRDIFKLGVSELNELPYPPVKGDGALMEVSKRIFIAPAVLKLISEVMGEETAKGSLRTPSNPQEESKEMVWKRFIARVERMENIL